jgi:hypothetical protein
MYNYILLRTDSRSGLLRFGARTLECMRYGGGVGQND